MEPFVLLIKGLNCQSMDQIVILKNCNGTAWVGSLLINAQCCNLLASRAPPKRAPISQLAHSSLHQKRGLKMNTTNKCILMHFTN